MKSDFYFAVSGQDALFDDVKIWDVQLFSSNRP